MSYRLYILSLLFCLCLTSGPYAQGRFNVRDSLFRQQFSTLFRGTENGFRDVRGIPIPRGNGVVGYVLKLRPKGVTELMNIAVEGDNRLRVFFKLGDYSPDVVEVKRRFDDLLGLIGSLGGSNLKMQEDTSFMDTKIKAVVFCRKDSKACQEDYLVYVFFHKMFNNTYNVSVSLQSAREQ